MSKTQLERPKTRQQIKVKGKRRGCYVLDSQLLRLQGKKRTCGYKCLGLPFASRLH